MAGEMKTYTGIDTITIPRRNAFSVHAHDAALETVHELTPGNLPPFKLQCKVGAPMIITRNLSFENGLCNGTRVQVMQMNGDNLTCKVLTGPATNQIVM